MRYTEEQKEFRKLVLQLEKENTDEAQPSMEGLIESVKKVKWLKEMWRDESLLKLRSYINNDSLIVTLFARLNRCSLSGERYKYEVSIHKNDPRTIQIGGGYGASGIILTRCTKVDHIIFKTKYENVIHVIMSHIQKQHSK